MKIQQKYVDKEGYVKEESIGTLLTDVEYLTWSVFANDEGEFNEDETQYFYYGSEITKEDYNAYHINGNFEYLYDTATKSADAMIQEISLY